MRAARTAAAASTRRRQLTRLGSCVLGASLAASVLFAPGQARAEVSGTGKGITGGALLGAEIVVATEAALGLRTPWIYGVSALAGAGAGGVGGYYVENATSARLPVYMLVVGLGLVIPAIIFYVDATSEYRHESVPRPETPAEPPADPASRRDGSLSVAPSAPLGRPLVAVSDANGATATVPDVWISRVYTQREVQQFGVTQATQVLVPLIGGSF